MFYALNVRTARLWLLGLAAGVVGWAVWSWVEGTGPSLWETPVVFNDGFQGGPPAVPEPEAAGASTGGGAGMALPSTTSPAVEPALSPSGAPSPTEGMRGSPDELRAQRERLRSQEMELARQVLEDPQASETRKAEAQRELLQLLQRSRRELEMEQLLEAAGVTGAAVTIGDSGVQVVVPQPVTAQGAARIGELVARMAGVRRENISIIDSITAFAPGRPVEESQAER